MNGRSCRFLAILAVIGWTAVLPMKVMANSLTVGTSPIVVTDTRSPLSFTGTLVASISSGAWSIPSSGSGTYNFWVYSPDTTGFTTLVFDITVTTGDVGRVTLSGFDGYTTDVSYVSPAGGTRVDALSVDRDTLGVIGFNFDKNPIALGAGKTSQRYVIETNSPNWGSSLMGIIDGAGTTVPAFSVVPLPPAVWAGLSLMGLMGVKGYRRQRLIKAGE